MSWFNKHFPAILIGILLTMIFNIFMEWDLAGFITWMFIMGIEVFKWYHPKFEFDSNNLWAGALGIFLAVVCILLA